MFSYSLGWFDCCRLSILIRSDCVTLIINITHDVRFSGWEQLLEVVNVNINIRKIFDVQAFHQAAEMCKCTNSTVDPQTTHPSCQTKRVQQNPKRRLLKDFGQKTMTETRCVDISIYLSSCDTFLNIPIEKWAETQPHEFKWAMPWMPMVSVFPAATNLYFPYGSLNGK